MLRIRKIDMSNYNTVIIFTLVCVGILFLSLYLINVNQNSSWEKWRTETSEKAIIQDMNFVGNFTTLTDCTEMTLQLTEKNRFWNSTFRDAAHNYYRETCK